MSKNFKQINKTLQIHNAKIYNSRDLTRDPLTLEIEKQTLYFGGMISETERWIVDSPPLDDWDDHWTNIRPY